METILIRAVQLILALTLLVTIHEFGHFLFAKVFKVRVEKFCIFFDPWWTPFKFPKKPKDGKTQYCIGWLPLGGYVKIAGMIDESMDKEQMKQPEKPWEFRTKPAWQRLLIMFGGVLFNFILALIIYSMILFSWGETTLVNNTPELGLSYSETAKRCGFKDGDKLIEADGKSIEDEAQAILIPRRNGIYNNIDLLRTIANSRVIKVNRDGHDEYIHLTEEMGQNLIMDSVYFAEYRYPCIIDSIPPKSGAYDAGLKAGDKITEFNGMRIQSYKELIDQLKELRQAANDSNRVANVVYIRNGMPDTTSIKLNDKYQMNVFFKNSYQFVSTSKKEYSLLASIPAGVTLGVNTLKGYVSDMKYVFTKKGASSIGGFVTIANIFPQLWDWHRFWEMTAFLSIILAFMNILPIPALDGGHILFLFYEIIARRKPSDKFMEYAQITGMIILFALLIWANFNDILRIIL